MKFFAPYIKKTPKFRSATSSTGTLTGLLRKFISITMITVILSCSPLSIGIASSGPAVQVSRQQMKAVYLYNFLYFVTWPTNKTTAPDTEAFTIGIIGRSPVKQALISLEESLLNSGKKNIKIISYNRYIPGLDLSSCNMIFISSSEKDHFKEIISELGNAPILSVAEDDDFLDAGGMITIIEDHSKLRYKINRKALKDTGLRVSAQLLKSAVNF